MARRQRRGRGSLARNGHWRSSPHNHCRIRDRETRRLGDSETCNPRRKEWRSDKSLCGRHAGPARYLWPWPGYACERLRRHEKNQSAIFLAWRENFCGRESEVRDCGKIESEYFRRKKMFTLSAFADEIDPD